MDQPRVDMIINVLYLASLYLLHSKYIYIYIYIYIYTHPLEGFYITHDHIDVSFLFLLLKDLYELCKQYQLCK